MGRIATLLSFVRAIRNEAQVSDAKVDGGGGANITAEHFADPGDDSFPLNTDFVALTTAAGSGRESAVGYLDPLNEPKATAGDKRIYARDADTGLTVVDVWLKSTGEATTANASGSFTLGADGSISGTNANGFFTLQAGGDFVVNGVIIDSSGAMTVPASLTLNGKELDAHDHAILGGSSAPGPTGPNN